MSCPYLAITARCSCIASPVAYLQSSFELNEYCTAPRQEQCPFFSHTVSSEAFDLPDHRLWMLGSSLMRLKGVHAE
jgi:hypothetical protein